jgi:iron complex outermembrane receptor protein
MHSFAQEKDSIKMKVELGGVEIIGQRTPSVFNSPARTITVISPEEIKATHSSTLQDILEQIPFVDIRQRNIHGVQADVSFRGGSFDQVMILINGVNITDPQTGHFNLDLPVELGSVERIEILHGSGSRLYGSNALKGLIYIITRKNENTVTGGFDYGQHGLLHTFASAGIVTGKLYNNISFSKDISGGYTVNTDYNITHFYYRGGIKGRLAELGWQAGTGGKAFGANDFYSPSFPEQYEETSSKFGSIGLSTNGKIKFSATGYWRGHNDHFLLKRSDPKFYQNYHQTGIYGLRTNVLFTTALGKTSMGFDHRFEVIADFAVGNLHVRAEAHFDKAQERELP